MTMSKALMLRTLAAAARGRSALVKSPAARFIVEARGTTAVEFALIAPILIATILFLMSIGYMLVMSQTLDYATQKASRTIRTGQSSGVTQTNFRTGTLCPLLPSMFNCNDVIVNIQSVSTTDANYPNEYYSFVNAAQSGLVIPQLDNTKTNYYAANAQCVVYVQVLYPVNIFMSFLSSSTIATTYNGRKVYLIMATSTFLTEPFSGSTTTTC
jgi:Flp pilus assembly protein TadG